MTTDLKVIDQSIYIIVDGPSWTEAEANANKLGGHLVTINDAEENQWLVNNLSGSNNFYSNQYVDQFWIGYTDEANEGSWTWISGESSDYSNWTSYTPAGNGDHGEIVLSASIYGGWRSEAGAWNLSLIHI